MPVYEYECKKCGMISTRQRRARDRNKRVHCDYCKSRTPQLIISKVSSFALMGGAWASTGYNVGKPPSKKKVK